jgi:hypothetical protein
MGTVGRSTVTPETVQQSSLRADIKQLLDQTNGSCGTHRSSDQTGKGQMYTAYLKTSCRCRRSADGPGIHRQP